MTTITWSSGVTGDWFTASAWTPAIVPGAGDDVTIATNSGVVINSPTDPAASAASVTIATASNLQLENVAALSVAGGFANAGQLVMDGGPYGWAGASLTIGGTLDNTGVVNVSNDGSFGGYSPLVTQLTAAALIDATQSSAINLSGGTAALAELSIGSTAGFGIAGVVTGSVNLLKDSLIQFASGQLTSIASSSTLSLTGSNAFVADAGTIGSNSALTGLTSNAGNLEVNAQSTVALTGDLANSGAVGLDGGPYGYGGSTLTIAGTLTNTGAVNVSNGSAPKTPALVTRLSTAALIDAIPSSRIDVTGGTASLADLSIGSAAGFGTAGVVTGSVNLQDDALIQFTSGQLTSIASGAYLVLSGSNAFVADAGSTGSNSALTGLTSNAGDLDLGNAATVALSGTLANSGHVSILNGIAGQTTELSAGGLNNAGLITLGQGTTAPAVLQVQGTADNNAHGAIVGSGTIAANVTNAGGIVASGTLLVTGSIGGTGSLFVDNGNTLELGAAVGSGQAVVFGGNSGVLRIDALNAFSAAVGSFAVGDTIDLAATVANTVSYANGIATLEEVQGTSTATVGTVALSGLTNPAGLTLSSDGNAGTFLTEAACFAAGTRIRTATGAVAVEHLRPGDHVVARFGGTVPVIWVGHRHVNCRRHPRPYDVWPVRIRAGAFGRGTPADDLYLSPDHAVYDGGVLIPIRYLINGRTIVQQPVDEITYFHIELPTHDVIFADSLPCESYLDTGNRAAFANGGQAVALQPDFARRVWQASACAELVLNGPCLAAVRQRLLGEAIAAGFAMTQDANLRVLVDGQIIPVGIDGRIRHVLLPPEAGSVRLVSRVWVPAHMRPDEDDTRSLGVGISRIWLDRREVSLESHGLGRGWHRPEREWRWTDGDAALAPGRARHLAFHVAVAGTYWIERTDNNSATATDPTRLPWPATPPCSPPPPGRQTAPAPRPRHPRAPARRPG